jgi:hypothetical protein
MQDGGDIQALTMGEVRWETEIEMTEVLDIFQVSLTLAYDGSDEFDVDKGERTYVMYLFRPTWGGNSDFSTERGRLVDEKRKKIEEMREERRRF